MQYRIEGGNLPALIINLNPGETIVSESGGRTWSRGPIVTETKGGSAGKALGRLLTGESLSADDRQTSFTQMMELALGLAVDMA